MRSIAHAHMRILRICASYAQTTHPRIIYAECVSERMQGKFLLRPFETCGRGILCDFHCADSSFAWARDAVPFGGFALPHENTKGYAYTRVICAYSAHIRIRCAPTQNMRLYASHAHLPIICASTDTLRIIYAYTHKMRTYA